MFRLLYQRSEPALVLLVVFMALILAACSGDTASDGGTPCTIDEECGIGEYCKDGICTPFGGDDGPQFCSSDTDCPEGEICEQGICEPGERPDGGDGGADATGDEVPDGGDTEADSIVPQPQITLGGDVVIHEDQQGKTYEINYGSVTMGTPVERNLLIRNAGDADLEVTVITKSDDPQDEFSMAPSVPPEIVLEPGQDEVLVVIYEAKDGLTDRAVVKVFSNDPDEGEIDINLVSEFKGEARIHLDPVALVFGAVPIGQNPDMELDISNQGTGNAVLRIDSVEPQAGIANAFDVSLENPGGQAISPPLFINKGSFIVSRVTFLAPSRGVFDGDLIVISSDETASPSTVPMTASSGIPAILVDPENVDFGPVAANTSADLQEVSITNEGVGDLTIESIVLTGASSPDITLESIPAPLPAQPLILAPGNQAIVELGYHPGEVGSDMATMLITHDAPEPGQQLQVLVAGEGYQGNARPVAVILANGADTALLNIMLGEQVVLDGTDSYDTDGTVTGYHWELIEQPSQNNCGEPFSLSGTTNDVTSVIPTEAGLTRIGLVVTDDATAESDQDVLDIEVAARPVAAIKEGGNDTGFVEVDMNDVVVFDATLASDCDGAVTDYEWTIEQYPPGRVGPPAIGGGELYATINFDFPGDYIIGLVVGDNDVPQNMSEQATFDVHVRGPKAFRVTLDWFDSGAASRKVDVDLHLMKPGSTDMCEADDESCSPDDCCPDKGGVDGCIPNPDWGVYGSPVYGTDNWEDTDGNAGPGNPGIPADELSFTTPGMGEYDLFVQFRCHSSADSSNYICCDDFFPCPFTITCTGDTCDRAASGLVRFYVTGYDDTEEEVTQKSFGFTNGQAMTFFKIGTISWPAGTLQ